MGSLTAKDAKSYWPSTCLLAFQGWKGEEQSRQVCAGLPGEGVLAGPPMPGEYYLRGFAHLLLGPPTPHAYPPPMRTHPPLLLARLRLELESNLQGLPLSV